MAIGVLVTTRKHGHPSHRGMTADAVFTGVGGILVGNGQGGVPNRIPRRLGHEVRHPTIPWLMKVVIEIVAVAGLAGVGTGQGIQHLNHVVGLGAGL